MHLILLVSIISVVGGLMASKTKIVSSPPFMRAVLWDVDGTLADSFLLGFTSTNAVFRNNGMPEIGEDLYHQGTKLTTPRRMAWHSTGNPDHESGIELGAQFDDLYVKLVTKETAAFYDGIQDVLTGLFKKHPTLRQGALSNACGAYVRAVLDANGVTDDFVVGLGADEVPKAKPSGEGLLQICETLKIHPSQCIYVGDSPSGVTWGSHPVETVQPAFTHTVHSTEALGLILSQMLDSPL
jgi:phosphoglycolate phosphatase-like HAD superfamily hydrolase